MGQASDPDVEYLSDLSPGDKPWDTHKWESTRIAALYQGTPYFKLSDRINQCGGLLSFCRTEHRDTGERKLKLKACRFCRARHCPICQWRRALMWIARFLKALPRIEHDYPTVRWIFITLTIKNCNLTDLRDTIAELNAAWKRLSVRKQFPLIGFARALEVTKGKDGSAHPHFHVLGMVKTTYFKADQYLSQADWTTLWQDCLQVDYTPVVHVQAVKPSKKFGDNAVRAAIAETFKYTVKPGDLAGKGTDSDRAWLVELTSQLHKTRAITLGGVLKQYLSEAEPENLIGEEFEPEVIEQAERLVFGWREQARRYGRKRTVSAE